MIPLPHSEKKKCQERKYVKNQRISVNRYKIRRTKRKTAPIFKNALKDCVNF